ncbi:MAG: glycosyltransferase family 39 protein [Bacteroidales bacterium]|nr:glycosyltransferase family 39 protein [Bacteroidales bacterium]
MVAKNIRNRSRKLIATFIFSMVFIALFIIFNLNRTFLLPPQSIHIWRQTNSLSLTLNYYQYDLPLFEPEMHNQLSDHGNSGKAVGEFPIIYYLVGKLWKITGHKEWLFRTLQILILFVGLWCLFQILHNLFDNWFWSGFLTLLLFTSPMLVFYGPNFLPDGPSLGFVFISWYFIMKFYQKRSTTFLWLSAIFFSLSILLKITSSLSFIAFGGWIVYELIFLQEDKRIFNFKWEHFLPFVISIILITAWYLYVEYYNKLHQGHFSYHGILPIWNITKEQYLRIIDALKKIYFKEFFLPFTQYLTLVIWFFLLIMLRRLKLVFQFFFLVLSAGFALQLFLWFQVLEGHDYYMINLLVTFVAIWAILFHKLRNWRYFKSPLIYFAGIIFFSWNVITCKERISIRYDSWMNDMYSKQFAVLKEVEPFFESIGLKQDDKVISLPDFTINGSLYFMNRKGYTQFGSDFSKAEGFYDRIEDGAKFLVINDTTILRNPEIQPFVNKKVGEYKNIWVYDLQEIHINQ